VTANGSETSLLESGPAAMFFSFRNGMAYQDVLACRARSGPALPLARGWWFVAVLVMLGLWFWDGLLHHEETEIPFMRLALLAIVAWAPFAVRQFIQEQRARRSGMARPFPNAPR
jgi:hypothetical protein